MTTFKHILFISILIFVKQSYSNQNKVACGGDDNTVNPALRDFETMKTNIWVEHNSDTKETHLICKELYHVFPFTNKTDLIIKCEDKEWKYYNEQDATWVGIHGIGECMEIQDKSDYCKLPDEVQNEDNDYFKQTKYAGITQYMDTFYLTCKSNKRKLALHCMPPTAETEAGCDGNDGNSAFSHMDFVFHCTHGVYNLDESQIQHINQPNVYTFVDKSRLQDGFKEYEIIQVFERKHEHMRYVGFYRPKSGVSFEYKSLSDNANNENYAVVNEVSVDGLPLFAPKDQTYYDYNNCSGLILPVMYTYNSDLNNFQSTEQISCEERQLYCSYEKIQRDLRQKRMLISFMRSVNFVVKCKDDDSQIIIKFDDTTQTVDDYEINSCQDFQAFMAKNPCCVVPQTQAN